MQTDGIARQNKIKIRVVKTADLLRNSVRPAKILKLLGYLEAKQAFRVSLALILSFALSIYASQVLAKTKFALPTGLQRAGENANAAAANNAVLAVSETPATFTLNPNVLTKPGEVYLPIEKIILPDPLKDRKNFLRRYLEAKGSVLADHVDALSEQTQWKLIIAISRAESSFCKHHIQYNCWGVGGAWDPARYASYDQAIADVNKLLQKKYIDAGLKTPAEIERKWVGYKSPNWQEAVQEELDNLSEVK